VETLDLLQDILGEYDGTVLLVSHDRDFIDRIATATVALEGQGKATVYPGGWSDYAAQRPAVVAEAARPVARPAQTEKPTNTAPEPAKADRKGLSFTEKKRLDDLPAIMERLEAEIGKLNEFLSAPDLFTKEPIKFRKATEALTERQKALSEAEEEWLALADRA
jgi:ATP-binding cassette subfamily F protein uup